LCAAGSYESLSPSSSALWYPGNLFTEWGTYNPPSTAPFKQPKTLEPVVVLYKPVSKTALNGLLSSLGFSLTSYFSPSILSFPL